MKTSGSGFNYFDGSLTDGTTTMRVVGFDTKLQQKLAYFKASDEPVAVLNCQVKEGKWTSDLEIHTRTSTDILKSPKKLDTTSIIEKLPDLSEVIEVKNEEKMKNGLIKQECVVSDSTGTARITAWEDNVDLFVENNSYSLTGVTVRSFKGKKFLAIPKDGFKTELIQDIGAVAQRDPDRETNRTLKNVEVCGVKSFDCYNACYSCKSKVHPTNDKLGKCNRCNTIQRLDKCVPQTTAKLELRSENECKVFSCFSPVVEKICGCNNVSMDALLFSEGFDADCNDRGVITAIRR